MVANNFGRNGRLMKKLKIWCLFDDCYGSWNKFSKDQEDHYISIGINDNNGSNYYKINLSIQNENLIKELEKLPKPDIIVASPPCESGSIADNQRRLGRKQAGRMIEVFTYQDELENRKIFNNGKRDYYKQGKTTLNGISTILGTLKIIDYFKPKYGVIENPATSKIGEFINENVKLEGFKNKAYYNAYNIEFTKKPTIFFSNLELKLKLDNIKQLIPWEKKIGYDKRSSIPQELLKDIIKQVKEKLMTKNSYDKKNNRYYHEYEYYCDCCLVKIKNGKIFRSEFAIDENKFDLCCDCKKHGDEKYDKGETND